MFHTIKNKFVFGLTIFLLVSIAPPIIYLANLMNENFKQRSEISLNTTLAIFKNSLYDSMLKGKQKNIQQIITKLNDDNNFCYIRLIDLNGNIQFATDKKNIGENIFRIIPNYKNINKRFDKQRTLRNGISVYETILPIKNQKECKKCHTAGNNIALLDISTYLTKAETKFFIGSSNFLFLGIGLLIILITGSYFLFNYFINKPLASILNSFDEVAGRNFKIRRKVKRKDEFGELDKHFNSMMNELENSRNEIERIHIEQLSKADKLATLGELTAEIAHEMNNQTAIIMSRAEYLEYEFSSKDELKKYSEDIKVILSQINKISKISSNILKHSKNPIVEQKKVSLNKIIEESIKIVEPLIHTKEILIINNCEIQKPFVIGDQNQLQQIIVNLLMNSIDAVDDEGKIIIHTMFNQFNEIELNISDNGKGISKEIIPKIFSPFYTTKSSEKGTGLGLYIVDKIIKNHNAEIHCESVVEKGTTFKIIFHNRQNL